MGQAVLWCEMNPQTKSELMGELWRWKSRQKCDGYLVLGMVIITLFPYANFLVSPGAATKLIMGLFLVGLVIACVRLLNSASKVAELRKLIWSSHETFGAVSLSYSEIQPDSASQARRNADRNRLN